MEDEDRVAALLQTICEELVLLNGQVNQQRAQVVQLNVTLKEMRDELGEHTELLERIKRSVS